VGTGVARKKLEGMEEKSPPPDDDDRERDISEDPFLTAVADDLHSVT